MGSFIIEPHHWTPVSSAEQKEEFKRLYKEDT